MPDKLIPIPDTMQVDLLGSREETMRYLQWVVYLNYERDGSIWN